MPPTMTFSPTSYRSSVASSDAGSPNSFSKQRRSSIGALGDIDSMTRKPIPHSHRSTPFSIASSPGGTPSPPGSFAKRRGSLTPKTIRPPLGGSDGETPDGSPRSLSAPASRRDRTNYYDGTKNHLWCTRDFNGKPIGESSSPASQIADASLVHYTLSDRPSGVSRACSRLAVCAARRRL